MWPARNTKLGRGVAIKTLPEEFAQDTNRLARFEREAKLLASLDHSRKFRRQEASLGRSGRRNLNDDPLCLIKGNKHSLLR